MDPAPRISEAPDLMTCAEAAPYLHCSAGTVRRMVAAGALDGALRRIGSKRLLSREALRRWIEDGDL